MGKFNNSLLLSDYDNTLQFTGVLASGAKDPPPIHPRNLEAIRYWMGEGGRFAVATGRALGAFRRQAEIVPMNAPSIVDNGGAIYDFASERYVVKTVLPEGTVERLAHIAERFPGLSLEVYHESRLVQTLRPVDWIYAHSKLTGLELQIIERISEETVTPPLAKALFVGDKSDLAAARTLMLEEGWGREYELIYSAGNLLEMTAAGANKGEMSKRLKNICGCERLYCAGDQANDLPMLQAADRAFVPSNSIPEVLASGATVVGHCVDGAVADMIEILDREA